MDIREYARKYNQRYVLSDKYLELGQCVPIIDMEKYPEYDSIYTAELVYDINQLNNENKRLREENERLRTSNSWLRANRKDCEKGRARERKQWLRFDEMRLEQLRDMHHIVKDEYSKRVKAETKLKKARRDYTSRRLYYE